MNIALSLLIFGTTVSAQTHFNTTVQFNDSTTAQLQSELTPLYTTKSSTISESFQRYLDYYGYNQTVPISIGTIPVDTFEIVTVISHHPTAKETVILFHGYLDNSGINTSLHHLLIEQNYNVVMIDLPGHGLSTGDRGSIEDFTTYGDVARTVIQTITDNINTDKVHLIGHSTGCAVIEELWRSDGKIWNGETILLAPLVRSAMWGISKWGFALAEPFRESLVRLYRKSSQNEQFLDFLQTEPLKIDIFPLRWGAALYKWESIIDSTIFANEPITVIQGDDDKTVDWEYNIEFFQRKFPQLQLHIIENARHHLQNETEPYRSQTFEIIVKTLAGKK